MSSPLLHNFILYCSFTLEKKINTLHDIVQRIYLILYVSVSLLLLFLLDTMVIEITAFDADEQGTPNSKIAYKVVQQEPDGEMMFKIERSSGKIVVKMNSLDREVRAAVTEIQTSQAVL